MSTCFCIESIRPGHSICIVIIIYSVMVYAGEEEEEADLGGRGDQIPRVVVGTKLRRWKLELSQLCVS